VEVLNADLVPDDHVFEIRFGTPTSSAVRATTYSLIDATAADTLFEFGHDLEGEGIGPVGSGLLPILSTLPEVRVNDATTGFVPSSPTNARLEVEYNGVLSKDVRRPGYPEDLTIEFFDQVVDTGLVSFPIPATPAKFTITAHGEEGDRRLDFRFRDRDADGTLSRAEEEFIDIFTYREEAPQQPELTWRVKLDTLGQSERGPLESPAAGDRFEIDLQVPYGAEDVLSFSTNGSRVESDLAASQFQEAKPYVVPNPYVGSASFEPERFAISGRGQRRIEFRGIPQDCTIRVYTVRGRLVQTLHHDGSTAGYLAWDLRTKDNLDLAPGLYIYHVDGGETGTTVGKFAVIK
jgi:hypothetical protein